MSVTYKTKLAFGIGAVGESGANWIFNALTFFFYNQVLGLSGTLTAAAVTIGLLFDAVSDPVMGSVSDRWRSRLGRRHPFMYAAPLPLIVAIYFIFNPPEGLAGFDLFLWFTFFTVLMKICTTLFAVPHLALGAELSEGYIERTRIFSYNTLFTYLGVVIMHAVVWFLIFPSYDNGRVTQEAYTPVVYFCASLIIICMLLSARGTQDQISKMAKVPDESSALSLKELFSDIYETLRNKNYRYLLFGLFFLSVTIGTHETLALYMDTFYWELTDEQIGWRILGTFLGYGFGFLVVAKVHQIIGKRIAIICSAVGLSVAWSAAVTLRLFDLAPENTTWELLAFVVFFGTIQSTFGAILNVSVMSALADIADEHELNTGRRQEGAFFSARTFFAKVTNSIGQIIAGIALDLIEFPVGKEAREIDPDKIYALGLLDGPFAMIFGLFAAAIYAGYQLDERKHAQIRAQLAKKARV